MMFPHDPLRQKMLFKTEWKSIGADGDAPWQLSASVNSAIRDLMEEGFSVSQIMPLTPTSGMGMLVVGQRVSSPVADPTPQGVPVPGTNAQQSIEVIYTYAESGEMKQQPVKSLQEAVRLAARDLEESARTGSRQPISIHVTSITAYGASDLHVLREKFG